MHKHKTPLSGVVVSLAMGKWVHRLSDIDPVAQTALCTHCGRIRVVASGHQHGWRCVYSKRRHKTHRRLISTSDACERCGFVPEHPCQLDVHLHRNEGNEEILCANCHRLETWNERH